MAITAETLRLVREMRANVNNITDHVTRGLTASWVLAWDSLSGLFLATVLDLLTLGAGGWPTRGQVLRARRTVAALDQAGHALDQLVAQVRRDVTNGARQAAEVGAQGQGEIIASQLPYGSTHAAAARTRRHQTDAVDAVVRRTAEQVTVRAYHLEADATEAMKRELVRGIVTGDNPRDAAAAMVRRVEGRFNGGLARAEVIARTEILDAHRHAAEVGQSGHDDVLDGWVWHAEISGPSRTRTCPSCWAKHGSVHPMSEPGPIDHHQGRCSRTPKTKSWADLGFDIPEPADETPNAREVFDGLPDADKVTIMGRRRLELLDSGAIAWEDLSQLRTTEDWRDSYHVRPVKDLERIAKTTT